MVKPSGKGALHGGSNLMVGFSAQPTHAREARHMIGVIIVICTSCGCLEPCQVPSKLVK